MTGFNCGSETVSMMAANRESSATADRGREAEQPTEIPPKGWKDIGVRAYRQAKADHVPLIAAGVAFYAMFGLFPGLLALATLYGLVADPGQIQTQLQSFTSALPPAALALITDQLGKAASSAEPRLTVGLVLSLSGVLWSASGGVGGLLMGINVAYDEDETRGFLARRGLALLLTVGAIVFAILVVALLAVLPAVLDSLGLGSLGQTALTVGRWPLLAALVMAGLAVLYRYAPDRDRARFAWVSPGTVVATVLWLAGSGALVLYVRNFGRYDQTYGAIGGVIVLLLWLFLSAFAVLFGAEFNAETERQTRRDSTTGTAKPLGRRGASAADTVGESTT
ncbi:MAG: YihY/virulence factor BrkB family protein [Egibacteraceae bacterium]